MHKCTQWIGYLRMGTWLPAEDRVAYCKQYEVRHKVHMNMLGCDWLWMLPLPAHRVISAHSGPLRVPIVATSFFRSLFDARRQTLKLRNVPTGGHKHERKTTAGQHIYKHITQPHAQHTMRLERRHCQNTKTGLNMHRRQCRPLLTTAIVTNPPGTNAQNTQHNNEPKPQRTLCPFTF